MKNAHNSHYTRLVLIDDDISFCKMLSSFALSRGIHLDCFSSLQEMGFIGLMSRYDAAIVDFDLGSMNGIEIAEYLPAFFSEMPMILISGRDRRCKSGGHWPISIKSFIHKDQGPDAILDAALAIAEKSFKNHDTLASAAC